MPRLSVEYHDQGSLGHLDFGQVPLNDVPVVRRVTVRNSNSSQSLNVRISTDLDGSLQPEKYVGGTTIIRPEHSPLVLVYDCAAMPLEGDGDINISEFSQQLMQSTCFETQFCEPLSRFELPPSQSKELLVVFQSTLLQHSGLNNSELPRSMSDPVCRCFDVRGTLDFESTLEESFQANTAVELVGVKISAKTCRSTLVCDVSELFFDNCPFGLVLSREFTVWNRSEVDTKFSFRFKSMHPHTQSFEFSEFDSGIIIRECELVSISSLSFSRFRIRYASLNLYPILKALRGHLLNFSPTDATDIEENVLPNSNSGQELQSAVIQHASMASVLTALFPESSSSASQFLSALTSLSDSEIASLNVFLPVFGLLPTGDFHHELEIENDFDSSNCFSVQFHGNLSFQARLQALEIYMGGKLGTDFDLGSALYGNPVCSRIELRNVSQESLEVHLASGSDEQIYFELDIEDGGFGENIQFIDQSESSESYSLDVAPVHDDFPAQYSESDQSGNVVSRRSRRHRIESISIQPGERRSLFIFVIPNLAVEIDAGIVNNIPETSEIAADALTMLAVLGTPRLFRGRVNVTCFDSQDRRLDRYSTQFRVSSTVFTPIISASTHTMDFNDCEIGVKKSFVLDIRNHSCTPIIISCLTTSKSLSFPRSKIHIGPLQTEPVVVDFVPRKIMHDYHNVLQIRNESNNENMLTINVHANNLDNQGTEVHSKLYQIFSRMSDNSFSIIRSAFHLTVFETAASNQLVKPIVFQNLSGNVLKIGLVCDPFDNLTFFSEHGSDNLTPTSVPDLFSSLVTTNVLDVSYLHSSKVYHAVFESEIGLEKPESFSSESEEMSFVLQVKKSHSEFQRARQFGLVTAVDQIELLAGELKIVYVLVNPNINSSASVAVSTLSGDVATDSLVLESGAAAGDPEADPRSLDSTRDNTLFRTNNFRFSVKLQLLDESYASFPSREIQINAQSCTSVARLGQNHVNFGQLSNFERLEKSILISNVSEMPLLYSIRKSGTIASGDISIPRFKIGVVPPNSSKSISFIFKPSLAGQFIEHIFVDNLLDQANTLSLVLKADIARSDHFWLKSMELECQTFISGIWSPEQSIFLKNISSKPRKFEISHQNWTDGASASCSVRFKLKSVQVLDDSVVPGALEPEEELEKLEQKFRIAVRKNKVEKAKKILERVSELREQLGLAAFDEPLVPDSIIPLNSAETLKTHDYSDWSEDSISFQLVPNAIQTIEAVFLATLSNRNQSQLDFYEGSIRLMESKNKDNFKCVRYSFILCSDRESYRLYKSGVLPRPVSMQRLASVSEQVDIDNNLTVELDSVADEDECATPIGPTTPVVDTVSYDFDVPQSDFGILANGVNLIFPSDMCRNSEVDKSCASTFQVELVRSGSMSFQIAFKSYSAAPVYFRFGHESSAGIRFLLRPSEFDDLPLALSFASNRLQSSELENESILQYMHAKDSIRNVFLEFKLDPFASKHVEIVCEEVRDFSLNAYQPWATAVQHQIICRLIVESRSLQADSPSVVETSVVPVVLPPLESGISISPSSVDLGNMQIDFNDDSSSTVCSVALTILNPQSKSVTVDLKRMISMGAGDSISFSCNQSKISLNAQETAEVQVDVHIAAVRFGSVAGYFYLVDESCDCILNVPFFVSLIPSVPISIRDFGNPKDVFDFGKVACGFESELLISKDFVIESSSSNFVLASITVDHQLAEVVSAEFVPAFDSKSEKCFGKMDFVPHMNTGVLLLPPKSCVKFTFQFRVPSSDFHFDFNFLVLIRYRSCRMFESDSHSEIKRLSSHEGDLGLPEMDFEPLDDHELEFQPGSNTSRRGAAEIQICPSVHDWKSHSVSCSMEESVAMALDLHQQMFSASRDSCFSMPSFLLSSQPFCVHPVIDSLVHRFLSKIEIFRTQVSVLPLPVLQNSGRLPNYSIVDGIVDFGRLQSNSEACVVFLECRNDSLGSVKLSVSGPPGSVCRVANSGASHILLDEDSSLEIGLLSGGQQCTLEFHLIVPSTGILHGCLSVFCRLLEINSSMIQTESVHRTWFRGFVSSASGGLIRPVMDNVVGNSSYNVGHAFVLPQSQNKDSVTWLIAPADNGGHFLFSNPLDVPLEIRGFSVLGLVLKVVEVRAGECTINVIEDSSINNPNSYKSVAFENHQNRGMSLILMPHSELVAAMGLVGLDHIHAAIEQHSLTGILLFEKRWNKSLKLVGWMIEATYSQCHVDVDVSLIDLGTVGWRTGFSMLNFGIRCTNSSSAGCKVLIDTNSFPNNSISCNSIEYLPSGFESEIRFALDPAQLTLGPHEYDIVISNYYNPAQVFHVPLRVQITDIEFSVSSSLIQSQSDELYSSDEPIFSISSHPLSIGKYKSTSPAQHRTSRQSIMHQRQSDGLHWFDALSQFADKNLIHHMFQTPLIGFEPSAEQATRVFRECLDFSHFLRQHNSLKNELPSLLPLFNALETLVWPFGKYLDSAELLKDSTTVAEVLMDPSWNVFNDVRSNVTLPNIVLQKRCEPVSEMVVVENKFGRTVEFCVELALEDSISDVVDVNIHIENSSEQESQHRLWNIRRSLSVVCKAGDKFAINITAQSQPKAFVPGLTDSKPYLIAALLIGCSDHLQRSTHIIKAGIEQDAPFSLSQDRIKFRPMASSFSTKSDYFYIKNNSAHALPLDLQLEPRCDDFEITIEPPVVPPFQTAKVSVFMHRIPPARNLSSSGSIAFSVIVSHSSMKHLNRSLEIIVERDTISLQPEPFIMSGSTPNASSIEVANSDICLRGCVAIPNSAQRYQVHLGQQDLDSGIHQWDLALENRKDGEVEYVVDVLGKFDSDLSAKSGTVSSRWLEISRTNGTLVGLNDTHTITLFLNTRSVGVFSDYLLIQNVSNAFDVKLVRVEMEVVASNDAQFLSSHELTAQFEVIVDGLNSKQDGESSHPTIEIDSFFGNLYRNRSFQISNLSNIPLTFDLKIQGSNRESSSELFLSLSNISLKTFHSLTIEAGHTVRIYFYFQPRLELTSPMDNLPAVVSKVYSVSINCLLIKNYSETILFQANCRQPQIDVSHSALTFFRPSCLESATLLSEFQDLVLHNLSFDELQLCCRNPTVYFTVQTQDLQCDNRGRLSCTVPAMTSVNLRVSLNAQAVFENRRHILKSRYLEEHMCIYNSNELKECHQVVLRINLLSSLHHAVFALEPKSGFGALENAVALFIRDFQVWKRNLIEFEPLLDTILVGAASEVHLADLVSKLAALSISDSFKLLEADCVFICDELIHFGLKGYVGHWIFQVGHLLWNCLLRDSTLLKLAQVFSAHPTEFRQVQVIWTMFPRLLKHLLDHFPKSYNGTAALRHLFENVRHVAFLQ